ncbi:MAG TPA: hypothetical protein VK038_11515 [Ornithinicoccus sp.]|jgi:hypothetical protein|nr:hypothetical protein [Ornithinicoccus sp.]
MPRRLIQLVLSCVVLGVGVSLLLDARLGSDGYSTLLNGLTLATGWSFLLVSLVVGVALLTVAWLRGRRPGIGTVVQTVAVGATINVVLPLMPAPDSLVLRGGEVLLGLLVLAVGVAGYLAVDLGAGPAEAAAQATEPAVPFRWSYTLLQVTAMGTGWLLGGDVGVATVLVALLIGPLVSRIQPWLTPAALRPATVAAAPGPAGSPETNAAPC